MSDVSRLPKDEMVRRIEARKDAVLGYATALKKRLSNLNDYYYRELLELAERGYFFETWMVENWIGAEMSPRRILEIGTRNGGSLIALLKPYRDYTGVKAVCFDIWTDPDKRVNRGSPKKVQGNLRHMGIPSDFIEFISGDSKVTVPEYVRTHPGAKFDYVLVDGGHDHETAAADLQNVEGLVAPGGVLIFDDISEVSYGLLPEWEAFKMRNGDRFDYYEVMHRKGIAWAFRRK
jgi:SAM-dependent methyltransferase